MRTLTLMIVIVAACAAVSARADEVVRRGGEWQSTVTGIGPQPQTVTMCFSQTTWEQAMSKLGNGTCAKKNVSKSGNVLTLDIDCGAMTMQGTATLSGDSAYTADLTMQMRQGANTKVIHTTTASKWIGACKPGERVID